LLVRFEEGLGGFASFINLFSIVAGVRRVPVVRQGVSPDVFGVWKYRIWCFAKNI
jgi:hypothetical protein